MTQRELSAYLDAEREEIRNYTRMHSKAHRCPDPHALALDWVARYAARFRAAWDEVHNGQSVV